MIEKTPKNKIIEKNTVVKYALNVTRKLTENLIFVFIVGAHINKIIATKYKIIVRIPGIE